METQPMTIRMPQDQYERLRRAAFDARAPMNTLITEGIDLRLDLDPNPLDARLLALAAILRDAGDETADEIETSAAFLREALRGSDDSGIVDGLQTVADYASDLAKIIRALSSAAPKADMDAHSEDTEKRS
jgi:hypothetical protein